MSERMTLSVVEAAQQLGIGKNTAYALVRRGDLPHIRIGGRIRVPAEQLKAWVNAHATGGVR